MEVYLESHNIRQNMNLIYFLYFGYMTGHIFPKLNEIVLLIRLKLDFYTQKLLVISTLLHFKSFEFNRRQADLKSMGAFRLFVIF